MSTPDSNQLTRVWAAILASIFLSGGYTALSSSDRFTGSDGARLDERLKIVEHTYKNLPPQWLVKDVHNLSVDVEKLKSEVSRLKYKYTTLGDTYP